MSERIFRALPRLAKRSLIIVLIAYAGVLLLFYFLQNLILFPPTGALSATPELHRWDFEDVLLDVGDGDKTHAWWVPLEGARGVVIHSHGNGANISGWLDTIRTLRGLGLSVLAYDYGGYGNSTGKPSEERVYRDIRAAWGHLVEQRGIEPRHIILHGRSLGGAPTAQLATEVAPAGVVLESTFASLARIAGETIRWAPSRWLVRYQFDTESKMKDIHAPVLVIHSPDDTLIPYHHGRAIFDAANEPKTFLAIRGGHNTGYFESEEIYLKGWRDFLDSILPPTSMPTPPAPPPARPPQ